MLPNGLYPHSATSLCISSVTVNRLPQGQAVLDIHVRCNRPCDTGTGTHNLIAQRTAISGHSV